MEKTSDPASGSVVQPGQEIKYTVKATNKSKTSIHDVVITDDLAAVLNHSVIVGTPDASVGDAKLEGTTLKWLIPDFAKKSEVTVTYRVKVNANANGVTINNVVFGNSGGEENALPPEKCTEAEPCDTKHNVPPVESPTGPTEPVVTPTDSPSNSMDPAVTPTDGGNNDDSGVHPHTGAGLTVLVGLLALILIGSGLVMRYASRQRRH